MQPLGFKKHLMTVLIGKALHLVLNGRTVARSDAVNDACVHGRTVQIRQNDVVNLLIRARYPTRHLTRMFRRRSEQRKLRHGIQISPLLFALAEVNRATVDAGWRSRLETPLRHAELLKALRQTNACRIPDSAGLIVLKTDVHHTVEKGAGAEHDCLRTEAKARLSHNAGNAAVLDDQIINSLLKDAEILLTLNTFAHGASIELAIDLGAGGLNGRAF